MYKNCSRPKAPISSGLKVILLPIIGFDPEKFPLLVSNNFFTYCTAPNVWQDNFSDEEPPSLLQGKNCY